LVWPARKNRGVAKADRYAGRAVKNKEFLHKKKKGETTLTNTQQKTNKGRKGHVIAKHNTEE